jgi:hypothetical protein
MPCCRTACSPTVRQRRCRCCCRPRRTRRAPRLKPCAPGLASPMPDCRHRALPRWRSPTSTSHGGTRIAIDGHLDLEGASIFLPRYSGVRPIIRPATKTATMREDDHPVEAGADAAEDHLAELHQPHRHQSRRAACSESCIELTEPLEAAGRRRRPQRRVGHAEANLLALHVAPVCDSDACAASGHGFQAAA